MDVSLLDRCFWCNARDCPASGWEQRDPSGWERLCEACAAVRLASRYDPQLAMREIEETPEATEGRPWSRTPE